MLPCPLQLDHRLQLWAPHSEGCTAALGQAQRRRPEGWMPCCVVNELNSLERRKHKEDIVYVSKHLKGCHTEDEICFLSFRSNKIKHPATP